jgi:exocyst complex component 4
MASDNCIPVKVALQLMDSSSLGLADQYDQFLEVHKQLKNALKVIVNEHHQGFNSSIGTFHKIQAAIHASQLRVRALRAGLVQAKNSLSTAKPELRAFAQTSQGYDTMLQVLGTIEQLQQVPEKLEAQISEKRFIGAVDTLLEALKLIRKPEMEEIGALSDLRVYLSNQEHSLADILIEELHNHLYLKSPYCEERWKAHMKRDSTNPGLGDGEKSMHIFLENFNGSKAMAEDTSRNPEADTFYYIQLILESLNKLSRLEFAVNSIEHRLPVELFKVVERSHVEVEQRHPAIMRAAGRSQQKKVGVHDGTDNEKKATLEDLLSTLFAKYEAIAEGHRVLHDVTAAIIRREGYDDAATLNRSFRELWKLLQSEIRSLLHDHLATKGDISHRARHDNGPSANIFRVQPRDRSRKIFKLSDTDSKSAELTTEREDLEFILKASVPGLVGTNQLHVKEESSAVTDMSATGHKLLVEPSVFNMGILLRPSLDFLKRLKEVVPANSGVVSNTLTSFLDDFLVNVFYPQLDETLLDLCSRSMTEMDAFQPDPQWHLYAQKPIFSGTARFYELVEAFCVMLDALPHDQSFSQLLITQMRAYYDKCYQWSKTLLQRAQLAPEDQGKLRLAAEITSSEENPINAVVVDVLRAATPDYRNILADKESSLLLQLVKTRRLDEADLIVDRKTLSSLCTLQVSLKWLATKCQSLRYISPRAIDTSNLQSHHTRRWTQNFNMGSAPDGAYLPLDSETAKQFDGVVTSFTELSLSTLRTLHIDLRLHLLHGIYASMDTSYALGQPYNDPNPAILHLSTSLGTYDAVITAHLLPTQYAFLTAHLHILANSALTSLVGCISAMDDHGCARMQLNVLVLQQSLKAAMQQDANLEIAGRFYALAEDGPALIAKEGPRGGYAREDLKALVRLCWDNQRDAKLGNVDEFVNRLG